MFLPAGADKLKTAVEGAKANGGTVTILWCEGIHSKRGVERLLQHPDNLAAVEKYEREFKTKIVVMAWLSGLPGIKATNFELRPDEYFTYPGNDFKFDWRDDVVRKVIVVPDTDNQGKLEAKALAKRLVEELGLSCFKMFKAAQVPNLKKEEIDGGWDDDDPLPPGVTPRQRLDQIFSPSCSRSA